MSFLFLLLLSPQIGETNFGEPEKIFSTPFFHSHLHPILTKENSICSSSSFMSFPSSCFHLNKRSLKEQIGLCEGCRVFFLIINWVCIGHWLRKQDFLLFSLILLLFMSFITLFGIIHRSYYIISATVQHNLKEITQILC